MLTIKNKKIIIILALMLCSCGFKLKGLYKIPQELKNINIITANYNAPFYKLLTNSLMQNGANITDNKQASVLEINLPSFNEEVFSYDSRGQTRQYKLVANLQYKVFANNGKLICQNTVTKTRNYVVNPNSLLSNSNEQQLVKEELIIEIINELLSQLSACKFL